MRIELSTQPKIGLALSGGQLKAAAHVGVLHAFEQMGIHPTCIAGTSAGSLVSALYAHGYNASDLQSLIHEFPIFRILDYGFPFSSAAISWLKRHNLFPGSHKVPPLPAGLLRGRKYISFIHELLSHREITTPYFAIATDLRSGQPVLFHSEKEATLRTESVWIEDPARVIAGSCAIPGIFSPVWLDPYLLIDGAFRDYVPVSVLRSYGCEKIIAVNLYHLREDVRIETLIDVVIRSIDILIKESVDNDVASGNGDVYVLAPDLSQVKWKSVREMRNCYHLGHQEVIKNQLGLQTFIASNQTSKKTNLPIVKVR